MSPSEMSWQPPSTVLGVLGGMGPAATVDFLDRVVAATPGERDQDHLPVIVYADPTTPDRSDAILGVGPDPLPALLRGIEFLVQAGCGLIAMPCNTAHHWYADLQQASPVEILHIADTVIDAVDAHDRASEIGTVGVLATDGTVRVRTYHDRIEAADRKVIDLAGDADNPAMASIRALKAGDIGAAQQLLVTAANRLVDRGAHALVIGCTDLSVVASAVEGKPAPVFTVPVFDAAGTLAHTAVDRTLAMMDDLRRSR